MNEIQNIKLCKSDWKYIKFVKKKQKKISKKKREKGQIVKCINLIKEKKRK